MPQGLCNAPDTFRRAMDEHLGYLKVSCVLIYLLDITVFSQVFQEHLEHLRLIFDCLRNAGLKLKPLKCSLFKKEVNFLVHSISHSGIVPHPCKFNAIFHMTRPSSLRNIQVFLGIVIYYLQFIPHFSSSTSLLCAS